MSVTIDQSDAIIGVDLQNDFMPGGALPVQEGDAIVPLINDLMECFPIRVLTRDWHPVNHVSFSGKPEFRDYSWPPHCIQGSKGAAFHPSLHVTAAHRIISKGQGLDREQYSGFQDTDLAGWLTNHGIRRVFITGLATEFCVKNTALDAKVAEFDTYIIEDAVRGINSPLGSEEAARYLLKAIGVKFISSHDLACPLPYYEMLRHGPEAVPVAA